MWYMKRMIIPVISGATGIVTKGLKKNLEAIPWNHRTGLIKQTAIFGTSHIILEVLQPETWSLSGGDYIWFKSSIGGEKACDNNDDDDDDDGDNNNNLPHRAVEQAKHRTKRTHNKDYVSHLLYMDDLKLIGKHRKNSINKCKKLDTSVLISVRILDLKSVQRLYSRKEN